MDYRRSSTKDQFLKDFEIIKFIAKLCGICSVIQSVIWIGFSIIGIISYYCILNNEDVNINLGSIMRLTFFELYFQNDDCNRNEFFQNQNIDFMKSKTTLNSEYIFYESGIYLGLSVAWLISSIPLIIHINEKNLRRSNILLYLWILITLMISILDVGSAVIFSLDYNEFNKIASKIDFNNDEHNLYHPIIVHSGLISSIVMIISSFRGFVLWILNVFFLIYFFAKTFIINAAISNNIENISSNAVIDTHSILRRPPINAHENSELNDAQHPSQTRHTVKLDTEPLARAYKMSIESLQERHNGFAFSNPNFNTSDPDEDNNNASKKVEQPNLPDPDYTPPMQRAFQNNIAPNQQIWKNKRFQ